MVFSFILQRRINLKETYEETLLVTSITKTFVIPSAIPETIVMRWDNRLHNLYVISIRQDFVTPLYITLNNAKNILENNWNSHGLFRVIYKIYNHRDEIVINWLDKILLAEKSKLKSTGQIYKNTIVINKMLPLTERITLKHTQSKKNNLNNFYYICER